MDHLIAKYLVGSLSLDEQRMLSQWLDSDPENRQTLEQLERYWKNYSVDLESRQLEVRQLIHDKIARREQTPMETADIRKVKRRALWLNIAATSILIVGLSYAIYNAREQQTPAAQKVTTIVEKVAQAGQKIVTALPDGTRVYLNCKSKILVPEVFDADRRVVRLEGEAFFDVVADPNRPFIINAGGLEVEVLGTAFDVNTYDSSAKSVAVKSGKVRIAEGGQSKELVQGEMATSIAGVISVSTISDEDLQFGWIEKKLVFRDHELSEIFEIISRWYGKEFTTLKSDFPKKRLTAVYSNPTLKEVLASVAHVFEFNYKIRNDEITIY